MKYINTKEGLYDLTDPNAPKLLGNMTAYANTLAEQNFQGYLDTIAGQKLANEKEWGGNKDTLTNSDWWKTFVSQERVGKLQREQGNAYQSLLKDTSFQEAIDPSVGRAPAQSYSGEPVKSGFDITPGQASQAQIDAYNNKTGEYANRVDDPVFNAASTGQSAVGVDPVVQVKDKTGNTINVKTSDIPKLIADGVLPNGTTTPNAPTVGTPGASVNRDLAAEQAFVKNWGGKGGRLPTTAEINQAVYGVASPNFSTPQGITGEKLSGGSAPVDLSGTTGGTGAGATATSNANTAATSVIADIKAKQAAIEATKTDTQKKDDSLLDSMLKDMGSLAGKSAYEEEQRKAKMGEGEANLNTQLTKSKNRIESLQAEKQKVLTDIEGKPITLSSIAGQQAQQIAKYNSEILIETAISNGLINNITLAEQQIQQAVDAKYAPIEEALAIAKAQREAIAGTLTKDEKIQSDALDAADEAKKQQIADAKTEETNIKNIMLEAMNAGITDKNILDKIVNSKSLTEAMSVLGDNIPKNADEKALVLDMAGKYSDAGILPTDTLAQATAKQKNSKIYQQQTRLSDGGGSGTADNYFTRPKADGTIGYYFGNEKNPSKAQEISQEQYNAGYYKMTPGESPEEKEIVAFKKSAQDLVPKLLNKEMTWGVAWDTLHTNYPEASADTINNALGGGIPYDPATGKFDTSKAWGTALKANK